MANQFRTNYFSYRGINSEDYNYMLVSVGSDATGTFMNGLDKDIEEENGIGDIKNLIKVTNKYQDFQMQIMKITSGGVLLPISSDDMFFLNNWIFNSNEYQALSYDGLVVNCIFTKSETFLNTGLQGYLNVTVHCEPYAKSSIRIERVVVSGSKDLILTNKSNVGNEIPVDMEITILSGTEVTIQNKTTGKYFRVANILTDNQKHFYVHNDGLRYIESMVDSDVNMLKLVDTTKKDWISLIYGKNRISILGNCEIIFKYQCKIQYGS